MAARKRSRVQIENDRILITQYYLQGKTHEEIAEIMQISRVMVTYEVRRIRQQFRESITERGNEIIARELAKLDLLEREYWKAWEKSKAPKVKTKSEKTESGDKAEQSGMIVKEEVTGDPRYLAGVQWCVDRRCELLGLDAPKRMSVFSSDALMKIDFNTLTKEQLKRIAEGEDITKVIPGYRLN